MGQSKSAAWDKIASAPTGWFPLLERRALYRGAFTSVADLKAANPIAPPAIEAVMEPSVEHLAQAAPFTVTPPAATTTIEPNEEGPPVNPEYGLVNTYFLPT